ncbi:MAG TPA: hypothetical protein VG271_13535 [Beijerinckiaceae bacterium]|jgi:hypothetical protein|nr:hypothetical protein [Beijerinckiaceae bacterium]
MSPALQLARLASFFLATIIGGIGIFIVAASLQATGLAIQALVPLATASALVVAGGAR